MCRQSVAFECMFTTNFCSQSVCLDLCKVTHTHTHGNQMLNYCCYLTVLESPWICKHTRWDSTWPSGAFSLIFLSAWHLKHCHFLCCCFSKIIVSPWPTALPEVKGELCISNFKTIWTGSHQKQKTNLKIYSSLGSQGQSAADEDRVYRLTESFRAVS